MNQQQKAQLYDQYMGEYDRLGNEIGLIKMNKFNLTKEDTDKVKLLEDKKRYIMGRVNSLG